MAQLSPYTMQIKELAITELHEYENNPRNNDGAVDAVAASIEEFGFKVPIIIDSDNTIVAGHTRLKAAKKLGYDVVPCIVADDLTPEQIKAFRLADNKTAEFAGWDFNKLEKELAELQRFEFDMSMFGFDECEINADDYGDDFTLPDGDKPEICQMTFTLHERQKELIEYAISIVKDDVAETFGNTNGNGNALYEVVKQWAEQRK